MTWKLLAMEARCKTATSARRAWCLLTRPPSDPSCKGKPTKADSKRLHQQTLGTRAVKPISCFMNLRLMPNWRKFWLIADGTVNSINYTDKAPWWRRMATMNRIYMNAPDVRVEDWNMLKAMTTMNVLASIGNGCVLHPIRLQGSTNTLNNDAWSLLPAVFDPDEVRPTCPTPHCRWIILSCVR